MKANSFKLIFLLLLLPGICIASNDFKGRYTKQKKITKQFNVNPRALLEINNSYGNIDITTWDQNRIEIEVIIKTNGNNEEEVIERLKEIDVAFNHSNSKVSAKTLFEEEDSSWWNLFTGGSNDVNMEINYIVKAPVTNSVNLMNDYGSISLDNLKGNARINCDYGKLIIGELHGNENILNFDYTRGSRIDFIKRGEINADYSEFKIEEAGTLDLNADYSESNIEKVTNIVFSCDYGSIYIGKVRNLKGQADYLRTELGAVYDSAELSLDYGSFSIENLMSGAKQLNITSDYTSLDIGYDENVPFSFEISTTYGGVDGIEEDAFVINKRHVESTESFYEGYHLSPSEGANIKIDTEYGNVTFEN